MKISPQHIKIIEELISKKDQQSFINTAIQKGIDKHKLDNIEEIEIFIDGGSRGNPGPSGGGFGIYRGGMLIDKGSEYFGIKTNNQSEYLALRMALRKVYKDYSELRIKCYMDSKLVVEQMNGNFKVKSPNVKPLYEETRRIADQFKIFSIHHIRREQNKLADQLANDAMDRGK